MATCDFCKRERGRKPNEASEVVIYRNGHRQLACGQHAGESRFVMLVTRGKMPAAVVPIALQQTPADE